MSDSLTNLFEPFSKIESMSKKCFELIEQERKHRINAENACRRKDESLAAAAHELRNALCSIGGWLNVLYSGNFAEPVACRAIEAIKRSFKLQTNLIEDLLDASQINRGRFRLNLREIEITPIIKNVLEDFVILAAAKQIELTSCLSANLGTIMADGERLAQVLCNLLSNAIKFTPVQGRISIKAKRYASFVEMQVIDTGRGIAFEFLPLIFDDFNQGDPSVTQKGLGLGLSIARQIVELHGGRIDAQSAGNDQGAIFTIQIPSNPALRTATNSQNFKISHSLKCRNSGAAR